VGSHLRVKVLATPGETVLAVGVVVRVFDDVEASGGDVTPGLAVALTSTNEAWDRFWDGIIALDDEAGP
jgi:hypothetical protein